MDHVIMPVAAPRALSELWQESTRQIEHMFPTVFSLTWPNARSYFLRLKDRKSVV